MTILIMEMMKTMNKPSNQKPAPYVGFGAEDKPDKVVVGFKSGRVNGYEVHICQSDKQEHYTEIAA